MPAKRRTNPRPVAGPAASPDNPSRIGPTPRTLGGPVDTASPTPKAAAPTPSGKARGGTPDTPQPLRILFVHGIGDQHTDLSWQTTWQDTVSRVIRQFAPSRPLEFYFSMYDDIVARHPLNPAVVTGAFFKLSGSGFYYGLQDLGSTIAGWFRPKARGLADIPHVLRWTAGMVAQWADDASLRAETRQRLLFDINAFDPHIIAAHSLGSLVAYDTFRQTDSASIARNRTFISFGSQIGNAYIRGTFGGKILPIQADRWFHCYNHNDHAFTASLDVSDTAESDFTQVDAEFDIENDFLNHDGGHYLAHPNVALRVWQAIALPDTGPARALFAETTRSLRAAARLHTPDRPRVDRALLIGINDYPDPAARLNGCVNDAFLMSSLLQEADPPFDPEDIRLVLNDRATTAGILERIRWTLQDAQPGDRRILFYSGHGAQIPAYGADQQVDHIDECLVPFDFDWSPEHAIIDKQILEFYTQLQYGVEFLAIFDCCHAGGIDRMGGGRARGLAPPDDIRHRALRWDPSTRMWLPRQLPPIPASIDKPDPSFVGTSGASNRLFRANPLRRIPKADLEAQPLDAERPFMPIIMEACQADQLAYEYQDGATSYGAFTFSLASTLRNPSTAPRPSPLTFSALIAEAARRIKSLGYIQDPALVAPTDTLTLPVPWGTSSARR